MGYLAIVKKSGKKDKKYKVDIYYNDKRIKSLHFGERGASDFTKHRDETKKKQYIARHRPRENWTKTGLQTAGFWSKHLLWNKPTLIKSGNDIKKKFNIDVAISFKW